MEMVMKPKTARAKRVPNPDQTVDITKLIDEVIPDPDFWKNTPNSLFGGQKPADFIGTPREQYLRDIVLSVKYGMFS
jgi:hypothetical protein